MDGGVERQMSLSGIRIPSPYPIGHDPIKPQTFKNVNILVTKYYMWGSIPNWNSNKLDMSKDWKIKKTFVFYTYLQLKWLKGSDQ